MARFSGLVGFARNIEVKRGIWQDVVTEKRYFGNVVRSSRQLRESENLNTNISINNSISIVADAFANENLFAIRYVEWGGGFWTVENVTVKHPRLVLRLGGVYNGERASRSD